MPGKLLAYLWCLQGKFRGHNSFGEIFFVVYVGLVAMDDSSNPYHLASFPIFVSLLTTDISQTISN